LPAAVKRLAGREMHMIFASAKLRLSAIGLRGTVEWSVFKHMYRVAHTVHGYVPVYPPAHRRFITGVVKRPPQNGETLAT
jgi:hypothetical protein